jgi:hypothetical protein
MIVRAAIYGNFLSVVKCIQLTILLFQPHYALLQPLIHHLTLVHWMS